MARVLSEPFLIVQSSLSHPATPELNKSPAPSVPKRGGLSTRLRVTGLGSLTSSLAESNSLPVLLFFLPLALSTIMLQIF